MPGDRDGTIVRAFHSFANLAARKMVKCIFAPVASIHLFQSDHAARDGAFLLAANHISHFDPPIISSVMRRKVDWMAMAEFFPVPVLGGILRGVDAFPAARDRADRTTIRTALERLRAGRIVGIFPEGGIRDGERSLLEGAPLRSGAATLAHMAKVPIVPCVILGTDRLYAKSNWRPTRGTPIWIGFAPAFAHDDGADKHAARKRVEEQLAAAFRSLYAEMQQHFGLTKEDLPHPPRARMEGTVK